MSSINKVKKPSPKYISTLALLLPLSPSLGINYTKVGIDDNDKSKEDGWSMVDPDIWLLKEKIFSKIIIFLI